MSVIWAEGFDDGVLRGNLTGNNLPTISSSVSRTGTRSLFCQAGANSQNSIYTISHVAMATGIVNFGFRVASLINNNQFFVLLDNGTVHLILRTRSDGKFELCRATGATVLATGTFVYTPGTFVHMQIKYLIADASGTFELRINGATTPDINFSGDTRNGANALVSQTVFCSNWDASANTAGIAHYFDDIVLQDLNGSAPENSWLGETEVPYLFPDAPGDNADFALAGSSPAATTWESLDEVPVSDTVDFITSATVGHKATVSFGNLSGAGTIFAVVGLMRARKAAAGTRNLKQSIKLAGTEVLGSEHAMSTSMLTYQNVWHRDPASAVWTTANVNAVKAGVEVVA